MTKTILDTNVILNRPKSLLDYEDVVIPYVVLKELDKFKNDYKIGYKAREATRIIIDKDIKCEKFFEDSNTYVDDLLIELTVDSDYKVITQDLLMYKKAEAVGGNVELYEPTGEIYTGVTERMLDQDEGYQLSKYGRIKYDNEDLYENQFIEGDILARYKNGFLHKLEYNRMVNGVEKPCIRQIMALDLLFDEDVHLVSITGDKGSGKTTLSINSAIELVQAGLYDRIVISRPKKQRNIDEGVGYLPGELHEKYKQFNAPFYDNIYTQNNIELEILPLSSIQGRNISNAVWVITEFQDISPEHTELIIGRAGKGTKMIIEGDIFQNSDNKLNNENNGLSHVINNLKGEKEVGTIMLNENKRSRLSDLSLKLRM